MRFCVVLGICFVLRDSLLVDSDITFQLSIVLGFVCVVWLWNVCERVVELFCFDNGLVWV